MGRRNPNETPEAIRERLIQIERAHHLNRTGMAKKLKISVSRWSNIVRRTPLSRQVMDMLIHEFPGLTEAWILRADASGLTSRMRDRLEAAEETAERLPEPAGS